MGGRSVLRKTLLVGVVAAAAASMAIIPGAAATPASASSVKWGPCPVAGPPGLQCATLRVPLNYQEPRGRKIDIEVSRLPSKNPAKRRGALLMNPGGPGGSGLLYPAALTIPEVSPSPLPKSVLDSYDLIGFDPRGVGHSTPVTCDLTPEQLAIGNLPYPKNAVDVLRQAKVAKAQAHQCATAKTGYMLPHMTTANTARDMDRIRAALGERKISYVGVSYGTYLGAVYTSLFPRRSDRFVLDSALGPNGYDIEATHAFGRGMRDRFPDFAKFAAAHPEYGLGNTPRQVTTKFYELAARLERKPLKGMTGSVFRGITFDQLYSDGNFPGMAKNWQALDQGQPVKIPEQMENAAASRFQVLCADSRWPRSILRYQVDVAINRIKYPMIGAATGNISACAYWQAAPVEPKVQITDRGPSNVLIVQNLRDPGTPLANARKLRRALGDRARMVTVGQGGHGVYTATSNKCGNNTVSDFLVTGQRPVTDTHCSAEKR